MRQFFGCAFIFMMPFLGACAGAQSKRIAKEQADAASMNIQVAVADIAEARKEGAAERAPQDLTRAEDNLRVARDNLKAGRYLEARRYAIASSGAANDAKKKAAEVLEREAKEREAAKKAPAAVSTPKPPKAPTPGTSSKKKASAK